MHETPERSGDEAQTAALLRDWLTDRGLDVTEGIGGHGLLAQIDGPKPRLLRADLDALPHGDGARHACGHDGHMAMLAGALDRLNGMDLERGVVALFQPAEEDGTGMAKCLQDARLTDLPIAECYAFHNVPGHSLGNVLIGPGALASVGIRMRFQGRQAHAAHPDEGLSPYPAMHHATAALGDLAGDLGPHALATLIHVRLGDEAYGTSPGAGVVAATLRGTDADVAEMRRRWSDAVTAAAGRITISSTDLDPFPETPNAEPAQEQVAAWAQAAGLRVERLDAPFPWSEDVGHAVQRWGGALIGLGAGTEHPPLHDDEYVFPDALLEPGIRLWTAIGSAP